MARILRRLRALTLVAIAAVTRGVVNVQLIDGTPAFLHLGRLRVIPPLAGADDGDDKDDAEKDDDKDTEPDDKDDDEDAEKDDDKAPDPAAEVARLREEIRKHRGTERRAKTAETRLKELEADAKKLADENKSEHEKAVEAAREAGKAEALTAAQKERRADRLESAVTRLAARGITVGDGDDAKTLKFADPEDAVVFIERAIAKGDLDEDDIFDEDHKVKSDEIEDELADLLKRKPRLADGGSSDGDGGPRKPKGGADGGKGKGAGKGLDELSPDEHLAAIRRRKD